MISDTATRLFFERGFDEVTIEEIAEAADVGRKTVFNHFAKKEELFFDREGELAASLVDCIRNRTAGTTASHALIRLAHRLVAEKSALTAFTPASQRFVAVIERSQTLKARARAAKEELAEHLAAALDVSEPSLARSGVNLLNASLIVTIWHVAIQHAHTCFATSHDTELAEQSFLKLLDHGFAGMDDISGR